MMSLSNQNSESVYKVKTIEMTWHEVNPTTSVNEIKTGLLILKLLKKILVSLTCYSHLQTK